jgi:hypothetical protein
MTSKGYVFDPGNFGTRLRLGSNPWSRQLFSGSLRSIVFEDLRDGVIELWPGKRQELHDLIARNRALAASILYASGKLVFFDASKEPMAIRYFERDSGMRLQVVHLVRDVRGVSLSRRKNRRELNWQRAVSAWVRMNRSIDRQLRRLPRSRWIRIRYEDLCRNPVATMNRFFQFCGLEEHDAVRDFSSTEHHIVGNRMRLAKTAEIKLDEDWRRTLMPDEIAHASKVAGSLHGKYGYPAMTASDLAAK